MLKVVDIRACVFIEKSKNEALEFKIGTLNNEIDDSNALIKELKDQILKQTKQIIATEEKAAMFESWSLKANTELKGILHL